MSHWEQKGKSDEWYTPQYIFDALGCRFDLDVAHPEGKPITPSDRVISCDSLNHEWNGFIWMNPPFGGRNAIIPWLSRFFDHGNGIALTPDRTSAPWFQVALKRCDAVLFISGKVKFVKPDRSTGDSPSNGTALFAVGQRGVDALIRAQREELGCLLVKPTNGTPAPPQDGA